MVADCMNDKRIAALQSQRLGHRRDAEANAVARQSPRAS